MVKLTACVIIKNEEKNIITYLKHIRPIVDEIVIVDTGSTDNTLNILKSLRMKFYQYPWHDDFADAKNFAISRASGNWILFLDADEYFVNTSKDKIKKNIAGIPQNTKIFMCRLTNINEHRENKDTVYVVRGFRNDHKLCYQGKVHEQLFYDNKEITDIAVMPDVEIYHTGYFSENITSKLQRNLKIINEDIKNNGENPRYYSALADCYYGLGNFDKAIIYAEKFIESGLKVIGGEEQIYLTLISAMRLSGKEEKDILTVLNRYNKKDLYVKLTAEKKKLMDDIYYFKNEKKKVFLSACVIVKNEEKNIITYLEHIKPVVDEIIVVDTGSTDKTCDIAKKEGAIVYKFKWCDDFAAAKNFAIDKANGKWIIFLDADEYFPEEDGKKIVNYIKKHDLDLNIDAIVCKLINIDADRNNEFIGSFYQLRVFRNSSDMRYEGKIHESLQGENGKNIKLTILKDNINIYHTGYSSSVMQEKAKRNLILLNKEIAENGEKPKYYAYLADCYYGMQNYEKTLYYAKKFIASGLNMIGAETNIYMRQVDALILTNHSDDEVITALDLAINKFPDIPDFLFMKSRFLIKKAYYVEAEKCLSKTFRLWHMGEKPVTSSAMPRLLTTFYETAGILAQIKNNIPDAINYYIKSLKENKYNINSFKKLYENIKKRNLGVIIRILNKIYGTEEENIKFLLKMLGNYSLGAVFLYYSNVAQKKYLSDISIEYDLLAKEKYTEMNDMLVIELEKNYKTLMLEILTDNSTKKYQQIYAILPDAYRKILDRAIEHFN
ncbi:glycosyltransferase family 2 protein [Pectinatus frisingensis]|jgi:glycosyltransferase involved in cell wall biosynthesis|uniref:glycosyltransferase family 2 protein n=1 Tax=Pectinatus frisingensis TaxID=865 RepID=UPI0015F5E190|nr:glycosyltransferase family 2 protein [Pectinatus frisingensis]